MKSLVKKSLRAGRQLLGNPGGRSRPGFLVGCGRSGTSMVVLQLGRSWQVDVYNEDHPAAFSNWRLHDLASVETLVSRSRAPLVLFKPILETHRSRALLDRFPDGRLLFSYRHVDDVVNSSLKKFGPADRIDHVNSWVSDGFAEFEDNPPSQSAQDQIRALWRPDLSAEDGAALYWILLNRLYFDLDLAGDSRARLVGYEAMVGNPEGQIRGICDFLELAYEPAMTAGIFGSSVRRDPPPSLNPAVRNACQEMWARLCRQRDPDLAFDHQRHS